ncbi:hypothetical protein X801_07624, partial [Opisthorchis viverrini]
MHNAEDISKITHQVCSSWNVTDDNKYNSLQMAMIHSAWIDSRIRSDTDWFPPPICIYYPKMFDKRCCQ